MSVGGGNIVVELTIDNKQFKAEVKGSGELVKQLGTQFDQSAKSAKRLEEAQLSLGTRFRHMVITMGALRFAAMDVYDIFMRLPAAIIKTAGELERTQALMAGLSSATTKAARDMEGAANFDYITKMARNAPFELSALADSFVKFKTGGLDPANGSMQSLVDSVARFGGTGETLKRASVAIQQMMGKSVISMEELRQQLGEAVPDAMKHMADGMGLTMGELAKVIETGTLAAEPALNKMFVRMRIANEGAAEEMMKTWVGMTSRLKTEWELTAKEIADAGAMEALKNVVSQLTAAMQSADFKRFAKDFGSAIGDVVNAASDVAQFLARYREEVILLGQAWLYYKAATSVVIPALRALKEAHAAVGSSYGKSIEQVTKAATERQQITLRAAQAEKAAELSRAVASRDASERMVAIRRAQLARLEADQAAHNARMAALQAALDASMARGGGVRIPGEAGGRMQSRDSVARRIADISATMAENSRQQEAFRNGIRASEQRMYEMSNAANGAQRALANMTTVVDGQSVALNRLRAVKMSLGTAFNALGGWITVLGFAITAGIALWDKYANAAERAAERARRATQGVSSAKDYADSVKALADAGKEMDAANNALKNVNNTRYGGAVVSAEEKALLEKNAAEARAEYERIAKEVTTHKKNVDRQEVDERVQSSIRATEEEARGASTASREAMAKLRAEKAQRLKGLKEGSKEYQAELNKIIREENAFSIESAQAQANVYDARMKEIAKKLQEGGLNSVDKEALLRESRDLATALEAQQNHITSAIRLRDEAIIRTTEKKDDNKGKGAKGNGLSRIDQLIERLKGEQAELKAEVESFTLTAGMADKAMAAAAKIRAQSALYATNKGKTPADKAKVDEAARLTEAVMKERDALKFAEDIAERGRAIGNDYREALETIANPLAKRPDLGLTGQLDDALAKTGMTIEQIAGRLGAGADEVVRIWTDLRAKMQTIDMAKVHQDAAQGIKELEDETAGANASMIRDETERARITQSLDIQTYAMRHRLRIQDMRRAAEAANDQAALARIDGMEAALNNTISAKILAMVNGTKTPMQQLVDNWNAASENMKKASVGWAESTMDSIHQMVMTGKADFKSLAVSILADMAKIALQKGIGGIVAKGASWLASAIPFENGGIMTNMGSVPLKKYAAGGVANSPQLALYGEGSKPEAYVPLPDGRTIPVTMTGGGEAGDVVSITINVTNNPDGSGKSSFDMAGNSDAYRRMGERIKGVVREELANQARPGGLLYR